MNPPLAQDKCPHCGAALAGGLCRQCLLLAGMETMVLPGGVGQTRGLSHEGMISDLFAELEDIRRIGRGGMGVVYQAHQRDVHRDIALKLLPLEMIDAPDAEERFEIEARAAARLDHPNIITLYEFGKRGDSLFLKMKLVEDGRSLAHALRERPWPVKESVALLIKLARAVHHAHQHGIIHRDIKPGNVLLDPQGEPFLSDFGLARIVEENTGLTHSQMVLGTASYMAPEQADGKKSDLTTGADVYSLGAVLYEMLAGKPPFDGASTAEILHHVIERDPVPPDTVNKSVDQDLSTICLKCLEKSPARRYGSAESLAEDLVLWQEGRPISARRISTAGRITKWVRRRPAVAVLTGALAASVVIGATFATWQAVRATHAEKIAKEEAAHALRSAKDAQDEAAINKAVNDFINYDLLSEANPDREPDHDLKMRTVLDRAGQRIGSRFQDQPLVEAAIRFTLAATYRSLGEYEKARLHAEQSVKLRSRILGPEHPETLTSRIELALALASLARSSEAEAENRAVLQIRERTLGAEHPETLIVRNNLALVLYDQGKYAEAEAEHRAILRIRERVLGPENIITLRSRSNRALALERLGADAEAEAEDRAVLKILERVLGSERSDTLNTRNNLAITLTDQGRYAEAEAENRAVLKIRERILGPENPQTLKSRMNLANSLNSQGKSVEAEAEHRAILAIRERVLAPDHPDILSSRMNLAHSIDSQGRHAEAEAQFRAVIKTQARALGPEHPDTLRSRMHLGIALYSQRKYAEAEAEQRTVLEIRERTLGLGNPHTVTSLQKLALCLQAQGKLDEAQEMECQATAAAVKIDPGPPPAAMSENKPANPPASPKKFWFNYNAQPSPGKRTWMVVDQNLWSEEYENGVKSLFKVVERSSWDGASGTVVLKIAGDPKATKTANDGFEVLIPDIGSPHMRLWIRSKSKGQWMGWKQLVDMRGVE